MLQGKSLILATKPFALESKGRSSMHLAIVLAILAALATAIIFCPFWPVKLVAGIIYSLTLIRLFILYHDFLHHAILNRSHIANAIMTLVGLYMLSPKSIWKRSHDYHHKHNSKLHTASIGSYPVVTVEKFKGMSASERRIYLITRHPITILFGYFTMFIYGMCIQSFLSSPWRHKDSLLSLILHVTGSALLIYFFGWQVWFFLIAMPFFITFAIGAYLFYAQHNFPGVVFSVKDNWVYEVAALESSSYLKMNPVMQWFTGNIGFHHIHHLNSRIPFYRLPEAYNALPELRKVKTTTFSWKDISKCLRLKLWDQEQQKMITLKEL